MGAKAWTAGRPLRTGMPCATPCSMPPYTSCSGRSSISRSLAMVSNTVTHAASSATRFTSCIWGRSAWSACSHTRMHSDEKDAHHEHCSAARRWVYWKLQLPITAAQQPHQPQHACSSHCQRPASGGGAVGSQVLTAHRTSRRRCDSEICSGTDWPGVSKSATLKAARPRTASMICALVVIR